MKTKIKTKIEEHKIEIKGCEAEIEKTQKLFKSSGTPNFSKLSELTVLKDKMLFHKGALAVLTDLLEGD